MSRHTCIENIYLSIPPPVTAPNALKIWGSCFLVSGFHLDFWIAPTQEIVVTGDRHQADTENMLNLIRSKFLPNAGILFHQSGNAKKIHINTTD